MKIKTKFSHAEQLVSDRGYLSMGVGPTIPDATYVLYFNGDGAEVSIKLSDHNPLYDELGMFAHENKDEFVFNIEGDIVDNHYKKQIDDLKLNLEEVSIEANHSNIELNHCKNTLKDIHKQFSEIKRKWWYKLFTWPW